MKGADMSLGFSIWAGALLKASQALKIYLVVLVLLSGSCCIGEHSKWRSSMAADGYQTPRTVFELCLEHLVHTPKVRSANHRQNCSFIRKFIHSSLGSALTKVRGRTNTWLISYLALQEENSGPFPWSASVYLLMQNIQWILCYKYNAENKLLQASHDTFNKIG